MEIEFKKTEELKVTLPDTTFKIAKFLTDIQNYNSIDEYVNDIICNDFVAFSQENQNTLERKHPLYNEVK